MLCTKAILASRLTINNSKIPRILIAVLLDPMMSPKHFQRPRLGATMKFELVEWPAVLIEIFRCWRCWIILRAQMFDFLMWSTKTFGIGSKVLASHHGSLHHLGNFGAWNVRIIGHSCICRRLSFSSMGLPRWLDWWPPIGQQVQLVHSYL